MQRHVKSDKKIMVQLNMSQWTQLNSTIAVLQEQY